MVGLIPLAAEQIVDGSTTAYDIPAQISYAMADAMLKARRDKT